MDLFRVFLLFIRLILEQISQLFLRVLFLQLVFLVALVF